MIVDAIFVIVQGVVIGFAALFPDDSPWDLVEWIQQMSSMLGALNYFLPIAEVFAVVVGVLAVFPFFMGTTLTLWVWSQIRGSSARG